MSVAVAMPVAQAAPTGDKRKQAEELENQIEASDVADRARSPRSSTRLTARRDAAQQTVQDAETQIAAAEAQVDRDPRPRRAEPGVAVPPDPPGLVGLLDGLRGRRPICSSGPSTRRPRTTMTTPCSSKLDAAQQDLAADRDDAQRARDAAAAESDKIAEAKAAFEAARAEQQASLDKVKGEIAAAVAAEQARRAEAARGAVLRRPSTTPTSVRRTAAHRRRSPSPGAWSGPATRRTRRLGPTYDCSGLVISAWGAAGVSLSGSSGSMYASLPAHPARRGPARRPDLLRRRWGQPRGPVRRGRHDHRRLQQPGLGPGARRSGAARWEQLGSSEPQSGSRSLRPHDTCGRAAGRSAAPGFRPPSKNSARALQCPVPPPVCPLN